jgi:hypothetical protein
VSDSGRSGNPEESPTLPAASSTEYLEVASDDKAIVSQEDHIVSAETSDDSVTAKAKESGKALKDLVISLAGKTKTTVQEKTEQLKDAANDERPLMTEDAADIQKLGGLIDNITMSFDETMDDIGKAPYDEQEKLMVGYKKVLEEEINVVSARLSMARRLTSVPKQTIEEGQGSATTLEAA